MMLLTAAAALAVGSVLLAAAAGHLREPRGTRAALAAHDLLPVGMRRVTAVLLAPVELLLGAALVLGAAGLGGSVPGTVGSWLLPVSAGASAVLLGGFTAYLARVLRRTRGGVEVPCGCGLGATPVGHWAVLRAVLLLALALVTVVGAAAGGVPDWSALPSGEAPALAQIFVVASAGLTLAVATAALPAARAVPSALITLPTGGGAR